MDTGSQGGGDSLLRRYGVGGGEEGEQGEEDKDWLEDGHAGEDVTEGADGEKEHGDGRGEGSFGFSAGRFSATREKLPAPEQKVGREEDTGKDGDGESAGRGEVDPGEAKEDCFEERPDGEGGGGVEITGDVPVAALEVADGTVAVPAFVGIFGPVHPGGVVGEVGVEMDGVENEECSGDDEQDGLGSLEDAERDGVRLVHGPKIKREVVARVPEYYRNSMEAREKCCDGGAGIAGMLFFDSIQ